LFLGILGAAGPAEAQDAAVPENRPTPLSGVENGRLPSSALISVAPGCRVARAAGPSLRLLLDLADANATPLGTTSCYRPVADQVGVRQQWTARGNAACAASVGTSPDGRVIGTSFHGWGKAADLSDANRSLTFASRAYRFLSSTAPRVGWNQPGWARAGGGPCPEPWHWEWVGDGGSVGRPPIPADAVALLQPAAPGTSAVVSGLGRVASPGGDASLGGVDNLPLAWVVVGADEAGSPGGGYYLVAGDGGVFAFGDAPFFGSTGGWSLNRPVVDLAVRPAAGGADGYWLVAGDGGVFSFGRAPFRGSTGSLKLNRPIVTMASTPSGDGYWLTATDGGVFAFGDARFFGSTGGLRLAEPVVAMAPTPSGGGYWMAAADGGVFAFGDARFLGSATGGGRSPVVDLVVSPTGLGYQLLRADGSITSFGDAA
jgi:hypothetical protein